MSRSLPGPVRSLLVSGSLLATLLVSACASQPAATTTEPTTTAKPSLATPPSSLMTPQGY